MNPSTAQARTLVDELVRGGVREAVLAPGSRNAPLSLALHAADAAGRLRLHVRIDERGAGFLALGLARGGAGPVAVTCTSGTAVANLHPAVLEAHHSGVPLVLLTADRPPELRGSGANQTTEQAGVFGASVRLAVDVGVAEARTGQAAYWRATVCRALAAATGRPSGDPGPVHLNLPLREPLLPDHPAGEREWPESLDGRQGGGPWTAVSEVDVQSGQIDWLAEGPARTVVVAGDAPRGGTGPLLELLGAARGWPVVAEPSSGAAGPAVLDSGTWLLGADEWLAGHRPERVVVVGRPTLSRPVATLLRDPAVQVDLVPDGPRWADPGHVAHRLLPTAPGRGDDSAALLERRPVDAAWCDGWHGADAAATAAVDAVLDDAAPSGLALARALGPALTTRSGESGARPLLVAGSSAPIRDLDLAGRLRGDRVRVLANRGLAGIDGTVSTAVGAALAHQHAGGGPAYALLGDLTVLHDTTGLVLGPDEPRPNLTVVVADNDGGAIFGLLEPGEDAHAGAFERVFGTPHGVDLAALCAATRTPYAEATPDDLAARIPTGPGIRVVRVALDRTADRALHARLRAAVAAALA